jgi:SAM-dependent methyltransferase
MQCDKALERIARLIAGETNGFTGGPAKRFGEVGRYTLESLQRAGLQPHHTLLDVGCGVLRIGYWLVRFLEADHYFGLEPVKMYVDAGVKYAVGPELMAQKRPRFDHNERFDFSPFGVTFDFVVARSIFSHASPALIGRALDSFCRTGSDSAVMLASYKQTLKEDGDAIIVDLNGEAGIWGWRRYATSYLIELAEERGLHAEPYERPFNGQRWMRFSKARI